MCLEQVLPTAPPSNQFATSKEVVCFQHVLKESDAACSRELGNDSGLTEMPLA